MEMKGLEIRMQIIMLHCGAVALWGRAFYVAQSSNDTAFPAHETNQYD